jgi:outer membrane lipoprotein SlyB
VIPIGTDITIHTDEPIDSKTSSTGQLYAATVSDDVTDAAGGIAIPAGTLAKLVVRDITTGGAVHTPELVLDLFSITVKGQEYRVVSGDVDVSGRKSVGANKRTAEFGGGGAAIGALLGAAFGGGKGAGIGALAGGGGGVLTQLFTRGKQVKMPAEAMLTFRLDRTLVLRPKSASGN